MDSIFHLNAEARGRFLRAVARTLGCVYICLWSYLPRPSNCLICIDRWFHEDESSSSGSHAQRLFNSYWGSSYNLESRNTVPGLAYREGSSYLELEYSALMDASQMRIQRQFYQEAGIQTAVFMGCKNGEIELGMSTSSNINLQMDIRNLFGEDFMQSHLGELTAPDQSWPSSSSSSLRSLSMGSPENTSLLRNKVSTSFVSEAFKEMTTQQASQPTSILVPPHQMTMQCYSQYGKVQFPTLASEDEAMTRAMLAVISATSSSSMSYRPPHPAQSQQSRMNRPLGAFKPYKSALAPCAQPRLHSRGQMMIKTAITILKRINLLRGEGDRMQESRPTSTQLHHMISERKRREKLNENFEALRSLLPPETKKHKATVLASTRDYLNSLKTQVSELEERNKMLEAQLQSTDATKEEVGDSSERVSLQIIRASESSSSAQRITLRITVRIECDLVELVLRILECLKESRDIRMVSVDASTNSPQMDIFARVALTLQIKASDWDEESFKEAVTRAVEGLVARPEDETP